MFDPVPTNNYRPWKSFGDGDDHDSPPLWRTSPNSSSQQRKNHYRSLSPASRTQAIARGQKELMEMVSKMPESCYELSLRDLVEQPMLDLKQESFREEKTENKVNLKKSGGGGGGGGDNNKVHRSGSFDNDRFLLKMVFPVGLGYRRNNNNKKKIDSFGANGNNSSKIVIPKSPIVVERSESDGSSNSRSSSNSNSNSRQGSVGCWAFMRTKMGSRKVEE